MKKIIFLLLFILVISSISVSARLTVGEALKDTARDTGSFLKGLLTASADSNEAYLFVFLAYFIISFAIFYEGVRFLPLFGGKGTANNAGIAFSFAAALLSTAALFMLEGQSAGDRVRALVELFGFWFGLVLSAIVAFVSFKFSKHLGLEGHTATAVGVALSMAAITVGVVLNFPNAVGWGFLVLFVLIVVGTVGKLGLFGAKKVIEGGKAVAKKSEELEKEEKDKEKAEKDTKKREKLLSATRGFVINVTNAINDLEDNIDKRSRDGLINSNNAYNEIEENLRNARRELRRVRGDAKGGKKEYLNHIYRYVKAEEKFAEKGVKDNIPENHNTLSDAEWENDVRNVEAALKELDARCGLVIKSIDKFLEKDKIDLALLKERGTAPNTRNPPRQPPY